MGFFAVAGSKLQVSISSVFTDIPGIENLQGPSGSKEEIDITAINDTAKAFIGGMPDFGQLTFKMAWDPANAAHQYLLTRYNTANVTDSWKIVCSDSGLAEIAFSGAVTGFQWDFSRGAAASVNVTVKISGAATVSP
jgi:hypothetical protein